MMDEQHLFVGISVVSINPGIRFRVAGYTVQLVVSGSDHMHVELSN